MLTNDRWLNSPVTVVNGITKAGGVYDGEQKLHSSFLYQNLRLFHLQRHKSRN